jgi:spore coat protein A
MKKKNVKSEDVSEESLKTKDMFRMNRRRFVQMAGATAAVIALGKGLNFDLFPTARAFYNSTGLAKFAQPLRGVGPGAIPVAVPDGTRSWDDGDIKAKHYTIDINQFQDTLHPDLGPTTLWGYNPRTALGVTGVPTQKHLGGIIVAQRGTPVQITVNNKLPGTHILPVDVSANFPDAAEGRVNSASTHLHGGLVPWISDGGPMTWFDPGGNYGPSVPSSAGNVFKLLNKKLQPGQAEYYYPNDQSARMMWYHDHAHDITRLNAYAGIASAFIIRDNFEKNLQKSGLPDFIENGGHEIPIIIQDKIFVGADIATTDPTWTGVNTPGSLWYPHTYEPERWTLDSRPSLPQDPSCIPEMFGDTMLANGVVFPKADVEPRRYRLRILNACQARFLNLMLFEDNGTEQPDFTKPGPAFLVIGAEGGFLANPASVNHSQMIFVDAPANTTVDPANPGGSLVTAPAERWDIIVDFSGYAGRNFILCNDAPAPYPGGDELNRYPRVDSSGNPVGNDTGTIMRFDVGTTITGSADKTLKISTTTKLALDHDSKIDPFLLPQGSVIQGGVVNLPTRTTRGDRITVRQLTLNEVFDQDGRLIQMLGTNQTIPLPAGFSMDPSNPDAPNNYARGYMDATTETTKAGSVEVWQIANLTGDTHPMHFHLVNVQLLARQPFIDAFGNYHYANGVPTYQGPARGPLSTELGWKETVKMNPGEVTTVIMKFDLPKVPFKVPASPRTGGNEYVWHCHILEHEEHDMMRPLVVTEKI